MNLTVPCSKDRCFGNRARKCRVLQEPIKKADCPFFQTDAQVKAGRDKAIQRLKDIGREDLIQQYTANVRNYAL